jgi:hypothetical protein
MRAFTLFSVAFSRERPVMRLSTEMVKDRRRFKNWLGTAGKATAKDRLAKADGAKDRIRSVEFGRLSSAAR